MAISSQNPELFRAILAMDAYHRGYGAAQSPNARTRPVPTGRPAPNSA